MNWESAVAWPGLVPRHLLKSFCFVSSVRLPVLSAEKEYNPVRYVRCYTAVIFFILGGAMHVYMIWYTLLYHALALLYSFSTVLYYYTVVPYYAIMCQTILYCIILYFIVLYYTILYYIVVAQISDRSKKTHTHTHTHTQQKKEKKKRD